MTRVGLAVVAVLGAAMTSGEALAQDGGWYAAVAGAAVFLEDTDGTIANAGAPGFTVRTKNDFETGYGVHAALGRRFGRVRVEGELGYTRSEQDRYVSIAPPTGTIPANVRQSAKRLMLNGYVDLNDGPLQPYVGAGVGAVELSLKFVAPRAPFPTEAPRELINDSDSRVAYQLMAGVAHPIGERLKLTAQYRWFDAGTMEARDTRGEAITRDHSGHHFDVGLRYAF